MAENNEPNNSKRTGAGASAGLPLTDILFTTLRHWPWIILSVVVCLTVAALYILRTPEVYSRSAEILIKDDAKGGGSSMEAFGDFDIFKSNTNITNEITAMQAKDLMEEVVLRLGLDVNYYKDGRFLDEIVYGTQLPVKVIFPPTAASEATAFRLKIDKEGTVKLSGFPDSDKTFSGKLNSTISTPAGVLIVQPTAAYKTGEKVDLAVTKLSLTAARDSYLSRLSVRLSNDKGSVIVLTLSDTSPERADDVLSTLIGVYNEAWIRDRNQIAVSTSNFINERLSVIESELGNVDDNISSFKSRNRVPDVGAASSMYMTQNQQTMSKMMELNNQLQMAKYVRSYTASDTNNSQLLPATGIDNGSIQSLITDYNSKLLQRNALVAKSSDKNPIVSQIEEQLTAQRQAIIQTIDNEILNLNTQLSALRGSEAQTLSMLESNPTQAKYLLSVERQQKVKESLYLFLLQKREENELSQAFTAYNTRIVNRPGPSGVPPVPNRRNILLIALVIGLVLPFGYFFAIETLNTRIRGRKDVQDLPLPFLGEIPEAGGKKRKNLFGKKTIEPHRSELLVHEGERNIINEAFRVLRTNVEFLHKENEATGSVVAITSFNPGSGKSFIAMNLGQTLSLKKRRVLVIDGDMRHGSASTYVGSPSRGLSDYLNGAIADVKSIIVPVDGSDYLSLLPIGTVPPNPTELLETPEFPHLIEELRPHFDYILIDCPPVEVVADAQIIDKEADRTIFVIRAGLLERSMLPELETYYETKKFKNMSFILNGTETINGRYGYSHGYRYGYGYSYVTDGKKH